MKTESKNMKIISAVLAIACASMINWALYRDLRIVGGAALMGGIVYVFLLVMAAMTKS